MSPFTQPKAIPLKRLSATLKKLGDGAALVRIGAEFRVIQIDPGLIRRCPHWHPGDTPGEALGSGIAHTFGKSIRTPLFDVKIRFGTQHNGVRTLNGKPQPCAYVETTIINPPPFWRGVATGIILGDFPPGSLERKSFIARGHLFGNHDEVIFMPFRLSTVKTKRRFYESEFVHYDDLCG